MKRQRNKRTQRHAKRNAGRKARTIPSKKVPKDVYQHPIFGEIPLIIVDITSAIGEVRQYWAWDPDFKPRMPQGAVRGDIECQPHGYQFPRYYYTDETKVCHDCREQFVFSAGEQKFWYETMKFCAESNAIRCAPCRRRQRRMKALHLELGKSLACLKVDPKNADELIALAKATVLLREMSQRGNLERAIGAARKAARLLSDKRKKEAEHWESAARKLVAQNFTT